VVPEKKVPGVKPTGKTSSKNVVGKEDKKEEKKAVAPSKVEKKDDGAGKKREIK